MPSSQPYYKKVKAYLEEHFTQENQIELYRRAYNSIISFSDVHEDCAGKTTEVLKELKPHCSDAIYLGTKTEINWKPSERKLDELAAEWLPSIYHDFYESRPDSDDDFEDFRPLIAWKNALIGFLKFHHENKKQFSEKNIVLVWKYIFLSQIIDCYNKCGLHIKLIEQRPDNTKRYNLYFRFKEDKNRPEFIFKVSMENLYKNFILPLLEVRRTLINGMPVNPNNILRVRITSMKYKDEEIPLFLKHKGLEATSEQFEIFSIFTDETNSILHSGVYKSHGLDAKWQQLHPDLFKLVKPLLILGDYGSAVFKSWTEVNSTVKQAFKQVKPTEKALDGYKLFGKCFSGEDVLFSFEQSETHKDSSIQKGYAALFQGGWQAFRNTLGHANEDTSEKDAFEILILLSHLLRKFQEAANPTEGSESQPAIT